MLSVSAQLLAAVTAPHTIDVTATATYAGAPTVDRLPIADGSVTIDRGAKCRRTLSLTVADPAYLPWEATDPLAVYGQSIIVKYGVMLGGVPEYATLGTFRIDQPAGDTLYGPVTLTGSSSECYIQDDVFSVPTSTAGLGTGCFDVIKSLIQQTLPSAAVINATSGARNPACALIAWDAGADRWDAVTQVGAAMQAEVYVDSNDTFVVAEIPNALTGTVAWEFSGGDGGTLMTAARQMSRSAVYNAVVASGENTATATAPVSATAKDTDPASPTRWGGPFGKVTKRYSSPLLTTVTACQSTANAMLFDAISPNVQPTITASCNPALEAGDIVRLVDGGHKTLHLLQALTIPLVPDGQASVALRGSKDDSA